MFNNSYNFIPYQSYGAKQGLFSLFKGKINWSTLLNNTQKTLNIINQAIPVFYQIKPMWNNTKTIFKIMGALKEDDKGTTPTTFSSKNVSNEKTQKTNVLNNTSSPNFFL